MELTEDSEWLGYGGPSSPSITMSAADVTTVCSYTTTAAKCPVPDSEYATMRYFDTLVLDNWPTYSAVCTAQGSYISQFSEVVTYSLDAWRIVTVLGETAPAKQTDSGIVTSTGVKGAKATSTSEAGASEVKAWVRGVVVVAAAAVMAV